MNDYTNVTCEEVAGWFSIDIEQLKKAKIVFAYYDHEDYEGSAFVLFKQGRKFYEVYGGHCSCYGLEGQWEPEETSVKELKLRMEKGSVSRWDDELKQALENLNKRKKSS